MKRIYYWAAFSVLIVAAFDSQVLGSVFTVSYLDGGTWNQVFAQGFSPSVGSIPNPGLAAGDTALLTEFEFFKSGTSDAASQIQLAIVGNMFTNLGGMNTSWPIVIGLSSNTVASTAPLALGDSISFSFNSLPLTYGNNYAAVFVNVGSGGELTPVLVSALTADYIESPAGSGTFVPVTNYGTESEFFVATSNFITSNTFGQFFNAFSFGGDANFRATFEAAPAPAAVPVPSSIVVAIGWLMCAAGRRWRSNDSR